MIRKKNIKPILLLASLILAITAVVGGTLAFLLDTAGPVENIFEPTRVPIEVEETLDGTTKKAVSIKNHGNIPAYIRVKVLINWVNDAGEIVIADGLPMEEKVLVGIAKEWEKHTDGYYYYTKPVPAGGSTGYLIGVEGYKYSEDTYNLQVEFLAQSIQTEPANVVVDMWDVDPTELG